MKVFERVWLNNHEVCVTYRHYLLILDNCGNILGRGVVTKTHKNFKYRNRYYIMSTIPFKIDQRMITYGQRYIERKRL